MSVTEPGRRADLVALDAEERHWAQLMRRAEVICRVPGLKKEIQGNPDAVAGIMLSLQGYGMATTIPAINSAFDWIEGRAEPSALFYEALAAHNGYRLSPRYRGPDKAVCVIRSPEGETVEIEFTAEDAIRAHRLDAWVEAYVDTGERWKDSGKPKMRKVVYTVRIDGAPLTWAGDTTVPLPERLPDWAQAQIEANEVKVFSAWWNYRTDMLWKSAAKRAVKVACPHVLLGAAEVEHEFAPPRVGWGSPPAGQDAVIDVDALDEPAEREPAFDEEGRPF